MKKILLLIPILSGCAGIAQVSPNITAQPGRGVSLERFSSEDSHCRSIARTSIINGHNSINSIYYTCMFAHGHQVPGMPAAQPPQARNR